MLNAIIGSISHTIIPFIAQTKITRESWPILATTYAKPSRGCIKQAKSHLKLITKGFDSVTSFLQSIKAKVDEFALFGAPLDAEDLTNKILDGLGEEYRDLTLVVQARDMPITFEELHEKLLNFEASAITPKPDPLQFPTTTNPTSRNPTPWPSPAPQAPTIIHGVPPTATKTGILLHKPATSPHLKVIAYLNHTWVIAKSVGYKDIQQNSVPHFG